MIAIAFFAAIIIVIFLVFQLVKDNKSFVSENEDSSTNGDTVKTFDKISHYTSVSLGTFKLPLWQPGQTITIKFLNGTKILHSTTEIIAKEWLQYANLHFVFVTSGKADIRVKFEDDPFQSWSFMGTQARGVHADEPTMRLPVNSGAEFKKSVLHEFGHVLGLIHETHNPNSNIKWDTLAVYKRYGGPPNNWSKPTIDEQIIGKYSNITPGWRPFDPKSIMLYPIERTLTLDGLETAENYELSESDKYIVAMLYPND
ncbi:MAG: hypothetical protein WKF97_13305 [Chitinophagaceae bacterium]